MGSVAAPVLLAVVVALVVLASSAVVSAGRPARELARDARQTLRDGLRRERWSAASADPADPGQRRRVLLVDTLGDTDDDEDAGSVTDLFEIGRADEDPYLRADRLAAALERAQGAVVGGVQQVQHRVRR